MKSRMDMAAKMPIANLFVLLCCCSLCPLVISATFAGFYWMLYAETTKVTDFDICGIKVISIDG